METRAIARSASAFVMVVAVVGASRALAQAPPEATPSCAAAYCEEGSNHPGMSVACDRGCECYDNCDGSGGGSADAPAGDGKGFRLNRLFFGLDGGSGWTTRQAGVADGKGSVTSDFELALLVGSPLLSVDLGSGFGLTHLHAPYFNGGKTLVYNPFFFGITTTPFSFGGSDGGVELRPDFGVDLVVDLLDSTPVKKASSSTAFGARLKAGLDLWFDDETGLGLDVLVPFIRAGSIADATSPTPIELRAPPVMVRFSFLWRDKKGNDRGW